MKHLLETSIFSRIYFFLLATFLLLAFLSHSTPYFSIDIFISHLVQSIKISGFSEVMWGVSSIGNTSTMPFLILIIGIMLIVLKQRTEAFFWVFSVISSLLLGSILKIIINRPRPLDSLVDVYSLLSDKSFPSNHTFLYTVLFGFLIYFVSLKNNKKKIRYLLIGILSLPIILIGISRIYLGVHWTSDVFGGYLIGFLWLHFSIYYYQRFRLNYPANG